MMVMAPTKANLLKAKSLLSFSIKGFELLDKKRNVLIRELMGLMKRAEILQRQISTAFIESYSALEYANITMGSAAVEEIAISIPLEEPYEILKHSVMGVELPEIKYQEVELQAPYGFFRSNPSLDVAVRSFNQIKYLVYELSELETSVFKLAMEIKKTQKRANALDKIQIPKYKALTKQIEEALEEKEREDFFRLKKVKDKTGSGS
jgi:V/A-type H+-transporting ATPase subunit D